MKIKINSIATISIFALSLMIAGTGITNAYRGGDFDRPELTEEQKSVFNQIYDLRINGNFEEANALAEEAGFPKMGMMGRGLKKSQAPYREDVEDAVENNDYQGFLNAVVGLPMEGKITSEIFDKMVKMHILREAGNYTEAREVMESLMEENDFGMLKGGRQGNGHGMMRNWNK